MLDSGLPSPKLNVDDVNYLLGCGIIKNISDLDDEKLIYNDFIPATFNFFNGEYSIIFMCYDGGADPHFHIVDNETMGDRFECCVSFFEPTYFIHNGIRNDRLTREMCNELDCTLRRSDDGILSNWQFLALNIGAQGAAWEKADYKNSQQPDYIKLFETE